ncbi:MAG: hypothetical protein HRT89_11675 [Lentisphaeria bacterium]|nr:hypothetical protein [Lentisphaeria bacterium]NQZ68715.1 hypothetical protein [Lentisphaeria bacterium]
MTKNHSNTAGFLLKKATIEIFNAFYAENSAKLDGFAVGITKFDSLLLN